MSVPDSFLAQLLDTSFAQHRAGRLAEAIAGYRAILQRDPGHCDALHLLGVATHQAGDSEAGAELVRRAIDANPADPYFYNSLGEIQRMCGLVAEAVGNFQIAIRLRPNFPEAFNNLGIACHVAGRRDEAERFCRHAIGLCPSYANACCSLGAILHDARQYTEAIDWYRRATELDPMHRSAFSNLGRALLEDGRVEEALRCYRRAGEIDPASASTCGYLLLPLHYLEASDPTIVFAEHLDWARRHAEPLSPVAGDARITDPVPARRLRVGYVSPDFRNHPVAFFIEPVLSHHDHSRFEIYCYSNASEPDDITARLRGYCDHWRDTGPVSDERLFAQIQADRIDILVDLAGHTAGNRLPVFARSPAPVQVTWLGYCDSTGMRSMHYRLTDAHADPPGMTEHLHTERLVRLPATAWCFQPLDRLRPVSPPPSAASGHVTFCCFNARPKITGEMLGLWAGILRDVPASRLMLKVPGLCNPGVRERLGAQLESAGIEIDRVELAGHASTLAEHLALHDRADIALDTFPYCGTTTTCEALWEAVPVITLAGRTHASRVGASLLRNVGLPELVAASAKDYAAIAVELATDPARLTELRATLRDRMVQSPLMDAPRFTRNIEATFREMWCDACAQRPS